MKKTTAKKFGVYSAIGVAGGMTFAATSAEADIIFADIQETATQDNPVSLDIDSDGMEDFLSDLRVVGPNVYGTDENWAALEAFGPNQFAFTIAAPGSNNIQYGPINIREGGTISNRSFVGGAGPLQLAYTSYNPGNVFGAFAPPQNSGYVGIEFLTGDGETVFGWIGVSVNGDVTNDNFADAEIEINGAAYATNGKTIVAGQRDAIPEPSSVGLLALGAAGIATRRRKNEKV